MKVKISKEDTKKGNLILVNSNYPLTHFPMEKSMTTILIGDREILLNHQAATILEQLLESLHYKGEIVAVSGFRSQEEQEEICRSDGSKAVLFTPEHASAHESS